MTDYHPKLWGSSSWIFLEYTALGYPDNPTEEDKERYSMLYKSLEYTLPCKECRQNFKIHIQETPIENYLKNSNTLFDWVIIMRNKVSLITHRPLKDAEKERTRMYKHNIQLKTNKPCCGAGKGRQIISAEQRQKNINDLRMKIRASKSNLKRVKERRELKKQKRKS